ncbi:hypothetical protein [Nocardia bovistercoris]|uniref:Uncharacterized protein n=1 Tax=Nocardia bovistercoris TaxID=2785916 RepID=A0A931I9E2_9NOCA|nr:hypothetical protein [Nocardia bovistercoris]MBH0775758.1 hypothetical protein [Nocardia bovistercoris]
MSDDPIARDRLKLSRKINRLFETMHPRSAPERSTASVAEQVSAAMRRTVPAQHIDRMRAGGYDEHGADTELLAAIAGCFGVKPDYLTTTGAAAVAIDRELELLATMRDANVASIALRGSDVDPARLADLIESTERLGPPSR